MGCGESKPSSGETVDYRNVSPFVSSYPPPQPCKLLRSQLYTPEDAKAVSDKLARMPKGSEASYPTLLKFLCQGETDVRKVRAIVDWMAQQNYKGTTYSSEKESDTPYGYIKMIRDGKGTIPAFFTILCRRSAVKCVILEGLGKGSSYEIGDDEASMRSTWNAVYVEGEWRLLHVPWDIYGNDGHKPSQLNDHFFLTDPEEFAASCLPEDYRWQLLKQPFTKKEYLGLPNIKPAFFDMDMHIISPKSGTSKVYNGHAIVEIGVSKKVINSVMMKYELALKEHMEPERGYDDSDDDDDNSSLDYLDRYVFMNRKPSRFVFELVFPRPGKYHLDLFGEIADDEIGMSRLCQFRFVSQQIPSEAEREPLPDAPAIGWGPGPTCRGLGLIPLSHHDGCIYIKPGEVRELRFKMKGELELETQLLNNTLPPDDLEDVIDHDIVGSEVRVKARIPEEGQYALKIYVREAGTRDAYKEAVNYLLRQQLRGKYSETYASGPNTRRKYRDKMIRARLEQHITNHTSEKELKDALDVFNCYNVPDQGEKKRANDKLTQYWLIKRELQAAYHRRHPGVLRKWIDKAHKSPYESDLQGDIRHAEHMEEKMGRLKGYLHPVARMEPHTIGEIRGYHRPVPVVHDVMTATYMLLGEDKRDLQDWEYIQYLMSRTGKEGLQRQVLERRPEDVPNKTLTQAERVLKPHTLQTAREGSVGTGTFYKWAHEFIRAGRSRDGKYSARRDYDDDDDPGYRVADSHRDTRASSHSERSLDPRWDTTREPKSYGDEGGRQSPVPHQQQDAFHPFGVEEKDGPRSPRKFFATASQPTSNRKQDPESYAGFKQ